MHFNKIVGHSSTKKHLLTSAANKRIPHAQLFVGEEGSGILLTAITYAQYVLCSNTGDENTGGNESCNLKFENFAHPDLHFVYPTVVTEDVKSKPKSLDFLPQWREFLTEKPYGSLFDWYNHIGVDNKQGIIRVEDASEIIHSLSLKSYEGGFKFMIVWMADKMNVEASNKLLKLLEEPTDKTVFILITENEEDLLQTIRSRCQVIRFNKLTDTEIAQHLIDFESIEPKKAHQVAQRCQGNYNRALQLCNNVNEDAPFEQWFVTWVRAAFRAKGNAAAIHDLINWSEEIAKLGRETQKKFLHFCIDLFRQALLTNYQASTLVYYESGIEGFDLQKFAPFITGNNINDIYKELNDAIYHIERNGNAKIILTDLSIKLTRLLHKH